MDVKLIDSELKVMEILWREGSVTAKRIAEIMSEQTGWSKTTTYTVIKKCIDKGVIERIDPDFLCRSLISMEEAQEYETNELINKMYDGYADKLIACVIGNKKLSREEIERLKQLIEKLK